MPSGRRCGAKWFSLEEGEIVGAGLFPLIVQSEDTFGHVTVLKLAHDNTLESDWKFGNWH